MESGPSSAGPAPEARPLRATTFLDVLREVDIPALDTLVRHISDVGYLGGARSTCQGLRQAVDGSVLQVSVTVRPALARGWNPGQRSPLSRLPRCTSVQVYVNPDGDTDDDDDDDDGGVVQPAAREMAAFVVLAFAGVGAAALQRITSLAISTSEWTEVSDSPPGIFTWLPALTCRLPSLRTLDLVYVAEGWPEPARMAIMYDLLATTLPHLEHLRLPELELVLPGIQALSLIQLDIGEVAQAGPLTRQSISVLAQLQLLKRLQVSFFRDGGDGGPDGEQGGDVLLLLDSLPASLEQLHLLYASYHGAYLSYKLNIELKAGRIEAVTTGPHDDLHMVDRLATLLLASRALPPQLPLLTCMALNNITSSALALPGVRRLLARCGRVNVEQMVLSVGEPVQTALEAVRVWGLPFKLHLGLLTVRLRSADSEGAPPGSAGGVLAPGEGSEQQQQQSHATSVKGPPQAADWQLGSVGVRTVLRVVVERMWSAPSPEASAVEACGRDAASTTVDGCGRSSGSGRSPGGVGSDATGSPVVMLRGSFIGVLSADPSALVSWLAWLGTQAAGMDTDGGGPAAAAGPGRQTVKSYQALPSVGAVLMLCKSDGAAAALAAAAMTVAAGAGDGLSASVLPERVARPMHYRFSEGARGVFDHHLHEVAQELWDGSAGCGLGVGERLVLLGQLSEQLRLVVPSLTVISN